MGGWVGQLGWVGGLPGPGAAPQGPPAPPPPPLLSKGLVEPCAEHISVALRGLDAVKRRNWTEDDECCEASAAGALPNIPDLFAAPMNLDATRHGAGAGDGYLVLVQESTFISV